MLVWSSVSLLALVIVVGLAGFIFVYHTLGKVGRDSALIDEARQQLDVPLSDEPKNILVLGVDNEPDFDTKRSDTIMLVRVNPGEENLSILAIPRDLIVNIPGRGMNKINSAYAMGGVPLAIDTVRDLTDEPIHHFVLVDYGGFEEAVDAMGGLYVDVDKRYFNDNSDAAPGEHYEPIDVDPGYQRLSGHDALAYVRYRHSDSDFMRIARQQNLIRDAKAQSLKWSNIAKIPEMADIFASHTASDIGKNDILSLTKFILSLNSDRIYQVQVPVEEKMGPEGSQITLARSAFYEAMDGFLSPEFDEPEPSPFIPLAEIPSNATKQLAIEVLNGNGIDGSAAQAANLLKEKGCTKVEVKGNAKNSYSENQILFREGNQAAAEELCSLMSPCEASPMPFETATEAQLLVVVGMSFEGQTPEAQPEAEPGVHFQENSNASWDKWKMAARELPFRVQKPASFPVEFDYVGFHSYDIDTDDGPKPALKVVCEDELGNNWGIMQTTFAEAPLLDNPTEEREISGRNYLFFYAGENLRYLAWREDDIVFWISNSLQNSLTAETMIRLAQSFRPVS